jgi:O-antigen/teichoic acid export membrane protein
MNDQSSMNKNDQTEPKSWREERWERRQARRVAMRSSGKTAPFIAGLLLVILGAVFLLQNFGNFSIPFKNWGALFLLIPVIALFDRCYRIYRNNGNQLTPQARGAGVTGMILLAVTGIILFDLNWTIWGPVLIILAGIGILISFILPNGNK